MRRRLRYALPVVTLVVLWMVGEVVLAQRLRAHKDEIRSRLPNRDSCMQSADDPLLYMYRPGVCDANSQGYPDVEHTLEPRPGSWRVVVIGDSVAAAQGVKREQGFGRVLEARLADAGIDAEVVVLARTGYSTSQELAILEREALAYRPEVIVWSYVLNDPAHPLFHDANGELGVYFHEPGSHVLHYLRKKWFRVQERKLSRGCPSEYHARLHCAYWDHVTENVQSIARVTQRANVPTVFLIHPILPMRGYESYPLDELHGKLADLARSNGLLVVDPLEEYRAATVERVRQEPVDPWHPNADGHAIVARALAETVSRIRRP